MDGISDRLPECGCLRPYPVLVFTRWGRQTGARGGNGTAMAKSQSRLAPAQQEAHRFGFHYHGARLHRRVANSSPARLALIVFVLVIMLFTALLSLPIAATDGKATPFHDALFTAVSAVCVTGLTTVSTALHWTFFGQLVILVGIFVGGLGILTLASLLALMVSKRLGVRGKLIAQEAMNAGRLGEVGTLLRIVITTSVASRSRWPLLLVAAVPGPGRDPCRRPSGTACSTPFPLSTTPASPRIQTAWSLTRTTCGSWSR